MNPQNVLLVLRLLLGLVLYLFLGSFLLALWRDQRHLQEDVYLPQDIQLMDESGLSFKLQGANLIGRAADNSILLPDDSVSAHHARLTYISGQWILEDLGSKNGTFVNDLPVDQALVVTDGDQIRFGALSFLLGREASETGNGVEAL
jgi:hypothetical protein